MRSRTAALAAVLAGLLVGMVAASASAATIKSNFNGTRIADGSGIWFNAVAKVKGTGDRQVVFTDQQVQYVLGGVAQVVDLPNSRVTFASGATASTTWNPVLNEWDTVVPASFDKNVFLGGGMYPVPAGGLPGGLNPVTWSGNFWAASGDVPSLQWQWAAAVYTAFPSDPADLGVLPADSGHHAGTPENITQFVVGGARGGGGSNFTGSYSATGGATCSDTGEGGCTTGDPTGGGGTGGDGGGPGGIG